MFTSLSLTPKQSGYLGYGEFPGDRRVLFADLGTRSIFGVISPPLLTPNARKLQLDDPICVKKLQRNYSLLIKKHDLAAKCFTL